MENRQERILKDAINMEISLTFLMIQLSLCNL